MSFQKRGLLAVRWNRITWNRIRSFEITLFISLYKLPQETAPANPFRRFTYPTLGNQPGFTSRAGVISNAGFAAGLLPGVNRTITCSLTK